MIPQWRDAGKPRPLLPSVIVSETQLSGVMLMLSNQDMLVQCHSCCITFGKITTEPSVASDWNS